MAPSVSVILSVYNGERYIAKAVESVLNQTLSDFEFIIIDDGSTDATSETLSSFSDPRIVRLRNQLNVGLVVSLNRAIRASSGSYLARVDADDVCHPSRLERQYEFMEQNPDVGVLGTWMEQIGENGNMLGVLTAPLSHNMIRWGMLFQTTVFHATTMLRRSVIEGAGGYDECFKHIEDTELWSRLVKSTRFANLGEVLYFRTWHSGSICNIHYSEQFRLGAVIRKRMFEDVTGKEVDEHVISSYSDFLNRAMRLSFLSKVRVVLLLLSAARQYKFLIGTPAERDALRCDVASRIGDLYKRNIISKTALGLKRLIESGFGVAG